MDLLIFMFGSAVTLIVGTALAAGIVANNRQLATDEKRALGHEPSTTPVAPSDSSLG